jgi:hypothetical protein
VKAGGSAMTVVMLAIFVAMVIVANGYPAGARFMPFVVGIPAIGLCVLELVLDVRRRRESATALPAAAPPTAVEDHEAPLSPQQTLRRELVLWAYFLSLIGGILLFGFWLTIPVFLAAFLRFQAGASWTRALLMSAVTLALLFAVFEQAFRIELHPGFVTEYLQDRLGDGS